MRRKRCLSHQLLPLQPRMREERRESLKLLVCADAAVVSLESKIRLAAHRVRTYFPLPTAHHATIALSYSSCRRDIDLRWRPTVTRDVRCWRANGRGSVAMRNRLSLGQAW